MDFRWTEWNVEHLARHGVDPEAEVIFVLGEDGSVYVVHGRPLTEREKQRHRRKTR